MELIGIIVTFLLLLAIIHGIVFFFYVLKVKTIEWIVYNPCTPSNIVFLIGFILYLFFKDRTVLHMAILPMFFFGVGSLFFSPWKGANLLPQIAHTIMAINIGWTFFVSVKTNDYIAAAVGLFLGIIIFSFLIRIQQNYVAAHPGDFERIMRMGKPKS
jgi:hypothetical protein